MTSTTHFIYPLTVHVSIVQFKCYTLQRFRNNRVKTIQMNDLKQSTPEEKTIPQKRDGKYHKLFKEFVENSSACGINKVFSSKPLLIRSIWFIICVICYGAMAYLSSMLIKQYLANPTSTFVDVSFQRVRKHVYYHF